MGQYKVLSPLKSGGKLREVGAEIELDEAVANALRPGSVEAVAVKAAPVVSGGSVPPGGAEKPADDLGQTPATEAPAKTPAPAPKVKPAETKPKARK